jgi:Transposase/Ornithine cyclodeaminase/mu-crystallin family
VRRVRDSGVGEGPPAVALVDLPAFGRPAVLVWRKRRWRCPEPACEVGTWTESDSRIAPVRAAMTDRAGRWVTVQVGREGRTVAEVARELGCDWHTVMGAVAAYGTPLVEDPERIGPVSALGLDETLFARTGRWRTQEWCTSIVDVGRPAQLLDVVAGRTAAGPSAWLEARPQAWRAGVAWGVLDLSGPYRKTFCDALPEAGQVADPFHLVKHAKSKLDECRRRVQNETLGHRGRRDDPLYRSRRLLTKGHERLDDRGEAKLLGLLEAGDPRGEVRLAWQALRDQGVVVLATKALEPVVDGEEFAAGGVVLSIGSTRFDLRELDRATFARAATVVADNPVQLATESGDVAEALRSGALSRRHIVALASVCAGDVRLRRTEDRDLLVFKSVGTALQDLAIARVVFEDAVKHGYGTELGELARVKPFAQTT